MRTTAHLLVALVAWILPTAAVANQAASGTEFCPSIESGITSRSQSSAASSFCHSYLSIRQKTVYVENITITHRDTSTVTTTHTIPGPERTSYSNTVTAIKTATTSKRVNSTSTKYTPLSGCPLPSTLTPSPPAESDSVYFTTLPSPKLTSACECLNLTTRRPTTLQGYTSTTITVNKTASPPPSPLDKDVVGANKTPQQVNATATGSKVTTIKGTTTVTETSTTTDTVTSVVATVTGISNFTLFGAPTNKYSTTARRNQDVFYADFVYFSAAYEVSSGVEWELVPGEPLLTGSLHLAALSFSSGGFLAVSDGPVRENAGLLACDIDRAAAGCLVQCSFSSGSYSTNYYGPAQHHAWLLASSSAGFDPLTVYAVGLTT